MRTVKHRQGLRKAVGVVTSFEVLDMPIKMSGRQISRLLYGDRLGCSRCFPHGWEVVNAKYKKEQRNWKRYRKTQWKPK